MYEGAVYITWLNVVGFIPFITVVKSKMYWQGVKLLLQDLTFTPKAVLFTPFQYILLFATVIKGITPTTFNHVIYDISDFLHFSAEIKCSQAAPFYILFLARKCKMSEMYTFYLVK